MMKSITFCAFAAAACLLVFSGCGRSSGEGGDNEFVMITEASFPPYEFISGDKIIVIDVEICRRIAAELGKELVVQDAKFDSVIPSLVAGKADIAAAGITVTEDRKMSVDFSESYVISGIVIIVRKDDAEIKSGADLIGKRVGVQAGTTSDTYMVEQKQEPDRFDSPALAVAALKAGKVDVVVADVDPARVIASKDPDIRILDGMLSSEEFAVAVRKGDKVTLDAANKVIRELKASGEIDKIKAQYEAEADKLKGNE